MKRFNIAFILSLAIHLLLAIIFVYVKVGGHVSEGKEIISVEFTTSPRDERPKPIPPKPKPLQTTNRADALSIKHSPTPPPKFDQRMDMRTAHRDIRATDESGVLFEIEVPDDSQSGTGTYNMRSDASGAGRNVKGEESKLVEFVAKSRGNRTIVYCLDVSASMGDANKLNLARNYLIDSLHALDSKKDKFNVIAFSNKVSIFSPGDPVPATKENLTAAIDFLSQYTPQSIKINTKTDILSPLLRAMEMNPDVIAMVTDGLPTAGETNPEKILQYVGEKNTDGRVRIFAIGMKMDPEVPEAWLLRAIAEQNSGEYQFF